MGSAEGGKGWGQAAASTWGSSGLAAGGTTCSQRRNVLSTDESGTACIQLLLWDVIFFFFPLQTDFIHTIWQHKTDFGASFSLAGKVH